MKPFKSIWAALAVSTLCISAVSCAKDDVEGSFRYNMKVRIEGSDDVNGEQDAIYATYQKALGVDSNEFTLSGKRTSCDYKVKAKCVIAEISLMGMSWTGTYTFNITRNLEEEIYSHSW